MIEEQGFSLLNQLPPLMAIIILILGVAVYYLRKDLKEEQKDNKANVKDHSVQLERISKEHKEENKELHSYVRNRDIENIETLANIDILLDQILENQKK